MQAAAAAAVQQCRGSKQGLSHSLHARPHPILELLWALEGHALVLWAGDEQRAAQDGLEHGDGGALVVLRRVQARGRLGAAPVRAAARGHAALWRPAVQRQSHPHALPEPTWSMWFSIVMVTG